MDCGLFCIVVVVIQVIVYKQHYERSRFGELKIEDAILTETQY